MSAIHRVMRAYTSKHRLNPSQIVFVRVELSKIIDEFMTSLRLATSDPKGRPNSREHLPRREARRQ